MRCVRGGADSGGRGEARVGRGTVCGAQHEDRVCVAHWAQGRVAPGPCGNAADERVRWQSGGGAATTNASSVGAANCLGRE
jgi:hypothetical protein